MSATASRHDYVLGRTPEEYDRLRVQARLWEPATARVLDEVGLAPGARCLDAGSGPGETMRLMAQRVGPAGSVTGVDVDAALGAQALGMLHADGYRQCAFEPFDVEAGAPLPGGRYDVVYARLLLFHVADQVAVVRALWDAVAPGGHLVLHDYDMRTVDVTPPLDTVEEFTRVATGAFERAGRHIHTGHRLPLLLAEAGAGAPEGTDVAGRLEPLARAGHMLLAVYRSVLPVALELGLTTRDESERWFEAMARDMAEHGEHATLWPLLIGAWARKAAA